MKHLTRFLLAGAAVALALPGTPAAQGGTVPAKVRPALADGLYTGYEVLTARAAPPLVAMRLDGAHMVFMDANATYFARWASPGEPTEGSDGSVSYPIDGTISAVYSTKGESLLGPKKLPAKTLARFKVLGAKVSLCATAPGSTAKRPTRAEAPDAGTQQRCFRLELVKAGGGR